MSNILLPNRFIHTFPDSDPDLQHQPLKNQKGGTPFALTDPVAVKDKIAAYFTKCDQGKKVAIIRKGRETTITRTIPKTTIGLAIALGLYGRGELNSYIHRLQEPPHPRMTNADIAVQRDIANAIALAKASCEDDIVTGGLVGEYEPKITGLVMSSDYGYQQRSQVDIESEGLEDILRRLHQSRQRQAVLRSEEALALPEGGDI